MDQEETEFEVRVEEVPQVRVLTPVGTFWTTTTTTISKMTDVELRNHITSLKDAVKNHERNLDRARTQLILANNEFETREEGYRRKLRNVKREPTAIKIAVSNASQGKPAGALRIIEKWREAGKTDAEIASIIQKLSLIAQAANKDK